MPDAKEPKRYVLRRAAPARAYRVDYERTLNGEQRAVVFAPDGPTLVVAGAGSGKTRTLVYRVSRLVEDGVAPQSLVLLTFTNRAAREMTRRVEGLLGADRGRSGKRKVAAMGMDYDDLLVSWKRLLTERAEVRGACGARYRHVLVDEYQDVNRLQAEIVDLLAADQSPKNVMVVGDDAQSIYSFRGADLESLLTFPERYPGTAVYRLETNYRSTPEILRLADASIASNSRRFEKTLIATRGPGVPVAVVGTADAAQQAQFVAQRVLELRDEGAPLSEISVLYRAHHQALELQMELTRRGIPFEIRSGARFFEQAHVKDVLAYLRLLVNPKDETSFKRVLKLLPKVAERTASTLL